jgi:hypothetical protein
MPCCSIRPISAASCRNVPYCGVVGRMGLESVVCRNVPNYIVVGRIRLTRECWRTEAFSGVNRLEIWMRLG